MKYKIFIVPVSLLISFVILYVNTGVRVTCKSLNVDYSSFSPSVIRKKIDKEGLILSDKVLKKITIPGFDFVVAPNEYSYKKELLPNNSIALSYASYNLKISIIPFVDVEQQNNVIKSKIRLYPNLNEVAEVGDLPVFQLLKRYAGLRLGDLRCIYNPEEEIKSLLADTFVVMHNGWMYKKIYVYELPNANGVLLKASKSISDNFVDVIFPYKDILGKNGYIIVSIYGAKEVVDSYFYSYINYENRFYRTYMDTPHKSINRIK